MQADQTQCEQGRPWRTSEEHVPVVSLGTLDCLSVCNSGKAPLLPFKLPLQLLPLSCCLQASHHVTAMACYEHSCLKTLCTSVKLNFCRAELHRVSVLMYKQACLL